MNHSFRVLLLLGHAVLALCLPLSLDARPDTESNESETRKDVPATHAGQEYVLLGLALEEAGHYEQALAAYYRALETGDDKVRKEVQPLILRATKSRNNFWNRDFYGWFIPQLRRFWVIIITLLALYLVFDGIGRLVSMRSSRIEILRFDDPSGSGLGTGFPALLRETFLSIRAVSQRSTGLLQGQVRASPVITPPQLVKSPNIDITLGGLRIGNVLQQVKTFVIRPRYLITGSVYRSGNDLRAVVELLRRNKLLRDWHFRLGTEQVDEGPSDYAYEILYYILEDWRHGG